MQNSNNKIVISNIMLIIAAIIWGSCYVTQKVAAGHMGAFTFMTARYGIGGLSLIVLIGFMEYWRRRSDRLAGVQTQPYGKAYFKKLFIVAPLCSFANLIGNVLVQIGLSYTAASKAGFLNSIYIIFIPILGYFIFKKKSGPQIFVGIILAVIGLYNLCFDADFTVEKGDLIILSATILFALHILLVSKYVHELVGVHFSCVEFVFATFVSLICALLIENPSFSQFEPCLMAVLYSGIFGVGVCYALQVTAQKYTDPTVAGLLMSLEAVFSAICGVIFLNETFTAKELVGIAFIVVAIVIAQLPDSAFKKVLKKQNK